VGDTATGMFPREKHARYRRQRGRPGDGRSTKRKEEENKAQGNLPTGRHLEPRNQRKKKALFTMFIKDKNSSNYLQCEVVVQNEGEVLTGRPYLLRGLNDWLDVQTGKRKGSSNSGELKLLNINAKKPKKKKERKKEDRGTAIRWLHRVERGANEERRFA